MRNTPPLERNNPSLRIMADHGAWYEPERLSKLLPTLLGSLGTALLVLVWGGGGWIAEILQNISAEDLKRLLLVAVACVLFLLAFWVAAANQNKTLIQQPRFVPALNARWKYWPSTKTYDRWPYCLCCEPPKPCQKAEGADPQGHQYFFCPQDRRAIGVERGRLAMRLEDHITNETLTLEQALPRLPRNPF